MRLNEPRACLRCGAEFSPGHRRGRFCSAACRAAAWREGRLRAASAATDEARRARDAEVRAEVRALLLTALESIEVARRRLGAP